MPSNWWADTKKMIDEAHREFWSKRGGIPTSDFRFEGTRPSGPRPSETSSGEQMNSASRKISTKKKKRKGKKK
jgi:hypothetical protein